MCIQKYLITCLILIELSLLVFGQSMSYDEFISSTPTTFGIITVTHSRNGAYSYFRTHLQRYATMECPSMTQISVVWNNDITPQQANFTQNSLWKRPVYFLKTPHNSMDFRYLVPKESKAKVFFTIDDDIVIQCAELMNSFALWRQNAIGDIAPLMSYGPRSFDFSSRTETFTYIDQLQAKFYSISLVGVAWIPRFYFDLYNTEKSWQITQLRKIVKQKNNCDDIALNYIVSYFFPELIPIQLKGQLTFKIHPASQGLTNTHYKLRNQCLKQFTQILGYLPLRIINRADDTKISRFNSTAKKYSIYIKRQQLYKLYVAKQNELTDVSKQQLNQMNEIMAKQLNDNKMTATANQQNNPLPNTQSMKQYQNQISQLKQQLSNIKQQYNKLLKQQNSKPTQVLNSNKKQGNKVQYTTLKEKVQVILDSMNWIINISIAIGVLFIFALGYLFSSCCSKKQLKKKNNNNAYQTDQMMEEEQNDIGNQ